MTKEQIREGIARKLLPDWASEEKESDISKSVYWLKAGEMLEYLHSQDVVMKVDRELPKNPYQHGWMQVERDAYDRALQDMVGYEAVELLIKGK